MGVEAALDLVTCFCVYFCDMDRCLVFPENIFIQVGGCT